MSETNAVSRFKSRLTGGERLVGTFFKTPAPVMAEVLGQSGLDVVCVDAEHAAFDRGSLDAVLAVLRLKDMPALVRIPAARPEHILTALDAGAVGVVVPHVTSAAEAAAVVKAAHFGPGGRGYAGSTRAAGFAGRPIGAHLARSAAETVVVAQIEDLEALDALDEILAVDGIDALFIGRIDLTVALGETSSDAPAVVAAVERIVARARAAGRTVGMFTPTVDEAVAWQAKGASFFLLGSDQGFVLAGANALAAAFVG